MLQALFGSNGSEKVLTFIAVRGQGYAREIARRSGMGLYPIQRQLDRLEQAGVLASQFVGRTRLYSFNPTYPLLNELKQLLDKAISLAAAGQAEPSAATVPPQVSVESARRMSQAELAAYIQERLKRG